MTEDLLERMHMADQDDDDADLKQLKQLRQVWLSMPDEDPPMKGLEALMAAARTKADEMQPKPSWWQRLAAMLVRPQVLALATVIVVAGGAVLINRHHDELDATKTVAEAQGSAAAAEQETAGNVDHARASGPGAATPAPPAVGGISNSASGSAAAPVVADPTPDTKPAEKQREVAKPAAHTSPPKKPKATISLEEGASGGKGGDKMLDDESDAPKQIVLTQKGAPTTTAPPPKAPMAEPPSPPPPPPPPSTEVKVDKKPVEPKPAATSKAQLATDNNVQNQPESVASMLARAHAAAANGDCSAAKAIAAKIANQDSAYYRSTALKDAVLVKCL